MIARIVLLSVFALVFLLALGLNRYLSRAFAERRLSRWLSHGLFIASILALLMSAAVIVINPTASYLARAELMLYVQMFYAGAGAALVCVVALAAMAGVIAVRRGDIRRFLERSVGFARRFANALKVACTVWVNQRATREWTAPSLNVSASFRDQREPTAFGDYLGREYMNQLGHDETKLDPFGLDNGPEKIGIADFSLDDEHY